MHQLDMAEHLLFTVLLLSGAGLLEAREYCVIHKYT